MPNSPSSKGAESLTSPPPARTGTSRSIRSASRSLRGNDGPEIVTALDEKPKSVGDRQLGRVRDILERPEVAIVADEYQEDWTRLGWVHLRGSASLLEPSDQGHSAAVAALRAKYHQYERMGLEDRPVIRIAIHSGSSGLGWGPRGRCPDPAIWRRWCGAGAPCGPSARRPCRGR